MFFPDNMTFQYFFFDTYPGYFLQVLPLALVASILYGLLRFGKGTRTPIGGKVMPCLFVCYIVGLAELVVFLKIISHFWYWLFYHQPYGNVIPFFTFWDYNFIPDFWTHLDGETIGNLIMFLPFGILFPFFKQDTTFGKTLLAGMICSLIIECLQPVFGRAFDINDIIMNALGVLISAIIFFVIKKMARAQKLK